ncbi:hypothetical protein I552_3793 [Mycobacterium xenopi 3993]|nr:hypothetical protein I552_3793 [Mycobacterium xenopi 3993]
MRWPLDRFSRSVYFLGRGLLQRRKLAEHRRPRHVYHA